MKPILLVPMAGRGQRFVDQGFVMPKPLVMVDDKCIIDWSFLSIDISQYDPIFVVREDHCNSFGLDEILRQKFGEDITIVKLNKPTRGSVETCLKGLEGLPREDRQLVVYTLDVHFRPTFDINKVDPELDGLILTFKANNRGYSYARVDENGLVTETAEKNVISENAAAGIYYFKSVIDFYAAGWRMVQEDMRTNGEFYLSPLYNLLIEKGAKVGIQSVDKMYVMGTPEELRFFQTVVNKQFGAKPVALCCDHSGLKLKNDAKRILESWGIPFVDMGTHVSKDCDYLDYVSQAAEYIQEGWCDFALGFCRTGQGVNMAANKQQGIRSALISDEFSAEMAVRHNAANFFCFSEKNTSKNDLATYLKVISSTSFDGGRFSDRIMKLES